MRNVISQHCPKRDNFKCLIHAFTNTFSTLKSYYLLDKIIDISHVHFLFPSVENILYWGFIIAQIPSKHYYMHTIRLYFKTPTRTVILVYLYSLLFVYLLNLSKLISRVYSKTNRYRSKLISRFYSKSNRYQTSIHINRSILIKFRMDFLRHIQS